MRKRTRGEKDAGGWGRKKKRQNPTIITKTNKPPQQQQQNLRLRAPNLGKHKAGFMSDKLSNSLWWEKRNADALELMPTSS